MFWFGKKENRSVEQIISDIAEHKRHSDIKILVSKLAGKPVFAPIPESMKKLAGNKYGETCKADGSDKFLWPYVEIKNLKLVQCLSGYNNIICNNSAMSMKFEEIKLMIFESNFDGLYIHNGDNSWCIITTEDLA
jgi:hypothetical protein